MESIEFQSQCWDTYNQELDFLSQWAQEAVGYDSENLCPSAYTDSDLEGPEDFDEIGTKLSCPVKRHQQRQAANQRERKRMRSINSAFDGLKGRIPISTAEKKKLSKVDTLKYAIQYIQNLSDILAECDDTLAFKRRDRKKIQEKVILKCKTDTSQDCTTNDSDICGHSLSWSDEKSDIQVTPEKKLRTKLWVPESAQIVDDSMFFGYDTPGSEYMQYSIMPEMIPSEQVWGYY